MDHLELDLLPTERARDDLDLDALATSDLVDTLVAEHASAAEAVRSAGPALARAIEAVALRLAGGGRLIYAGAGTAGRMGLIDAVECPPTFGTDPETVQALLAGGRRAATEVVEDGEDDTAAAERHVHELALGPTDALLALSASGSTPYALAALTAAAARGALTIGVTANAGTPLADRADIAVVAATGPEPLAGSTRLKAGTAQKVIVNTLSTAVMVRLGKTYGNRMVAVQASNAKLRDRAQRIVAEAAAVDREHALAALRASDWDVKAAIVSVRRGVDAATARRLLDEASGRLRLVVGDPPWGPGRDGSDQDPAGAD